LTGKARRIKQAREEAQAEIENYRRERERQFREYEAKYMGSREDIAAKIDKNTELMLCDVESDVKNNKEKVNDRKSAYHLKRRDSDSHRVAVLSNCSDNAV
jgi:V-type H+-transporting ATPase subunit G